MYKECLHWKVPAGILAVAVWLSPALAAQDLREIVRRMVRVVEKHAEVSRNYTYLQRQETRELDGSGKRKKTRIKTYDVTPLEGSPYMRLVAMNDQPLSPQDRASEEEKLKRSIEERRRETPEQRERRIAEWKSKEQKRREPFEELPDAFDLRLVRQESVNGREAWVIDGTPKPGYKPKLASSAFLSKVKFRLWVDQRDYAGVKLEMETLDTISMRGILVRLAKGGRLIIEQTRINDELWLPKRVEVEASARVLLIKGYRIQLEVTQSDFKKFQVDSRVLTGSH